MQSTANVIFLVAKTIGVMAEVSFLRKEFGSRYLGVHAALAFPIVVIYSMVWPGYDLRPLFAYLAFYIFMCLVAKADLVARGRERRGGHSRYDGMPRLAKLFPRCGEITIKRTLEPLVVFLLSMAVMPLDRPLGCYLLFTAVALLITINTMIAFEERRAADLHDLYLEQQQIATRVRGLRENCWPIYERRPP
jgi:hypothetical protein